VTKGNCTNKELMEDLVYFYNAFYYPSMTRGGFGRIEAIPLLEFSDPDWPLPDMATIEAIQAQLRGEFLASMKASTGSKATHLTWFMPIRVMVDLFAAASSIHKTRTLFVFKTITSQLCKSLMDEG
jgi:hypothetical protein